ncbi:MAG: 2-oxoglutarate oxidoreductase, alpha subunit [Candidatus Ozemobacter sibiricus]|jgi:2-oxoglutarate ferredoxin oxidoreductase subunit alpha|uniref:2-oxoglutarate oxidoreductase, alpha subunit n=1 Tax=Candidatus Ozemobacter sibiricus TaxID=2268124 RepID=A0A367ZNM0_9BACT|nr:MAG: 2-oxoglutarate oxidoreductase, alpha subunit [Candidatus Ozemobacter sibiricus]
MADKVLMKGNEVIGEAAVLAGCRYYFGYPITPQSEIPAYLSRRLPEVEGVFLQAESEVAAINMVYGAASAGARVMTSSSSPGVSLKQEGLSYIAGAELPCVVVNVVRGGPGLGNISPAQSDYWQATRGGGHGDYRTLVLAPNSVQEIADMTIAAFELADRFRNPVLLLVDGILGQMMEPVQLPAPLSYDLNQKPWALGNPNRKGGRNLCSTIFLDVEQLEEHNWHLYQKYQVVTDEFAKGAYQHLAVETHAVDDAEIILVGYGIISRILKTVVEKARKRGIKAGLVRPKTLWPFPSQVLADLAARTKQFLVVEMSCGQMVEDVKLAVNGRKPVFFFGRTGGTVPSDFEILNEVDKLVRPD